ncbi:hypothetical protein GCM10010392_54050 [Streptomyces clavifer]|nr:hypothetical protein GCM10010392_54050 [Streptomyces clavifer]
MLPPPAWALRSRIQPSLRRRSRPALFPRAGPLGVRLQGVRFDYGGGPVLDGVDPTVPAGQTLALVGASGAGKSTCAHILARFRDPAAGTVQLIPADGAPIDVREVDDAELRRSAALVGQETPLFLGTLADNLRLTAPTPTTTSSPKRHVCAASTESPRWTPWSEGAAPPSPEASEPASPSPPRS